MTMKTKRIASLLLSAALLLSLAVPAFAENPTTEETAEPETAVQEVEPEALTEDDAVAPVAEPTAKKEYTYVAIGDSVTAGVGLSGLQYKLVQKSYDVKVGDVIAIRFGARTLTVEVVSVTENVGKDAAAAMYKEV